MIFEPAKRFMVSKFDKDLLAYWHGQKEEKTTGGEKSKIKLVTQYDPEHPRGADPLPPGRQSPVCANCELYLQGSQNPFIAYQGADKPLVTIIFDSVTRAEDKIGELGNEGSPRIISRIIKAAERETGVKLSDVRWVPLTRCCNWNKPLDLKSRGNWCRYHLVDDIMRHPPNLLMPIGSVALGRLCHKSNAQEWTGRLLVYRGWPDAWLVNPKYALERPDPADNAKTTVGHPIFGKVPSWRIPMVPIQAPRVIQAEQNPVVGERWQRSIVQALKWAKNGVKPLNYNREHYKFTSHLSEIKKALDVLENLPAGTEVCYDTETTGLHPWATKWLPGTSLEVHDDFARIVSMMFRWTDPETNEPRSIGFPWDLRDADRRYDRASRERIDHLREQVWKVLCRSALIGHNLTFDMLFTWATLWRNEIKGGDKNTEWNNKKLVRKWDDPVFNRKWDRRMCKLADACKYDTWHMAFTWMQRRGSLGLDAVAYEWVPELAGYEEDFTLLIDLRYDEMHPGAGKGGHYLRCPKEENKKLEAYVMGDVEVAYHAYERILEKLEHAKVYEIPIANPAHPGGFRWFMPPGREWVYRRIISPASRVLMKMMARGLYIDKQVLHDLAEDMPNKIAKLRTEICTEIPEVEAYIAEMRNAALDGLWELDLENKTHLRTLLFERMNCPVLRLTKAYRKDNEDLDAFEERLRRNICKEKPDLKDENDIEAEVHKHMAACAAVDKFTLNKLTVQKPELRPLREYRKIFKLYSTYVRPLQNIQTAGLDKKARKADPHLCYDGCIHASFLLTGTRSGRLASRSPNLQQLPRDGQVKAMYTSRFGARGCMYQGDLSQIELRLLAAISGDPTMVKAYFDGIDLHSLTASRIFGTPYEHFTKEYMKWLQEKGRDDEAKELDQNRNIAKTTNFLTGYGGGAFGLQNVLAMKDIDKPLEECEGIIELFFDSYPSVRRLLQYYKRFILEKHVAVSLFGRLRVFEEVLGNDNEAKAKALRAGCNHLIQSTASDMMLTALFCIEKFMREDNLESILVSTVHDSLVIDSVREELPQIHDIVTMVLNNFPEVFKNLFGELFDTSWMLVPFSGDSEVGTDLLHLRKVPEKDVDWDKLLSVEKR